MTTALQFEVTNEDDITQILGIVVEDGHSELLLFWSKEKRALIVRCTPEETRWRFTHTMAGAHGWCFTIEDVVKQWRWC